MIAARVMAARSSLFFLLLASAGIARAEQGSAPTPSQPRTGPEAAPLPLPPYANPQQLPPAVAPPGPSTAPPAPPAASAAIITDVRIVADPASSPPLPPRTWSPPQDPASGFILQHRPGEPLDENWVRRQFTEHKLVPEGASVGRFLALVQLINRAYLGAGFVNSGLVTAPDAPLSGGTLSLRLVYGGLAPAQGAEEAITVRWADGKSRGLSEDFIRHRMSAADRRPLNAIAVERDFRLLAEDPAIRTINADLRPGARPGEASLELLVAPQDPFDVYLSFANSRSPSVGGERFAVGGFLRNGLSAGDILTAEFGITEGLEDASVSYVTPFLDRRTFLSARASYNDAAVTDTLLEPLDISSRDRSVEIGLSRRLVERPLTPTARAGRWSPAQTFTVGIALAHRRSKSFLFGEPFSFSPGSENGRSRYTALRFTADYVLRNVDQVFAASLTVTNGIDGTRSDAPGVPNPNKQFVAALAQFNYARRLTTSGLELRARLSGQLATGVLYSGERFSTGGEFTVRGYRENQLLTDEGIVGSVELVQPFSLAGARGSRSGFDYGAFAASIFADGAYVNNVDIPDPPKRHLYSVGASLAWTPSPAVSARVSYGIRLTGFDAGGERDLQDRGVHFRVTIFPLKLFGL